jgi:dCMP deaminase
MIAFSAKLGLPSKDTTVYITTEPCLECAKLLINAGIAEVVCLSHYRDPAGMELLRDAGVKVRYIEGICEECRIG